MSIKMPIKFHASYRVLTRRGGVEKQEVCQKLSMSPIAGQSPAGAEDSPAFLVTYFSFGCRRVLEGRLKENSEDRVVLQVDDREFEFSPSEKIC